MPTPSKRTVIINGRHYDAATGLPLKDSAAPATPATAATTAQPRRANTSEKIDVRRPASATLHASAQRSKTLNRRIAQKNSAKKPSQGRLMDIARSSKIEKFAPHPKAVAVARETPRLNETPDRPATNHPLVARVTAAAGAKPGSGRPGSGQRFPSFRRGQGIAQNIGMGIAKPATAGSVQVGPTPAPVSSKDVKNTAISKALENSQSTPTAERRAKRGFFGRHRRGFIVALICLVILVGGGYLGYKNLPFLSVTWASTQSGISATYPSYTPDGYSLQQPITYDDGEVTLQFRGNGGQAGYVITEERSSWDSTAVLNNIVKKAAGDNYQTTQDSGLTMYSYNDSISWVNAGILYTITNDSTLGNEQVNRIATSL